VAGANPESGIMSIIPLGPAKKVRNSWLVPDFCGRLLPPSSASAPKANVNSLAVTRPNPKKNPAGLMSAGSKSAFSGVSLYPPHRCFPSNGLAMPRQSHTDLQVCDA